jgi:hypothetical protein
MQNKIFGLSAAKLAERALRKTITEAIFFVECVHSSFSVVKKRRTVGAYSPASRRYSSVNAGSVFKAPPAIADS